MLLRKNKLFPFLGLVAIVAVTAQASPDFTYTLESHVPETFGINVVKTSCIHKGTIALSNWALNSGAPVTVTYDMDADGRGCDHASNLTLFLIGSNGDATYVKLGAESTASPIPVGPASIAATAYAQEIREDDPNSGFISNYDGGTSSDGKLWAIDPK